MANAEDHANNFLVVRLALHGDEHDELPIFYEAADEIRRLRTERDAARRELCRNEAIIRLQRNRIHRDSKDVVGLTKEISVERGWDCFKENTNG